MTEQLRAAPSSATLLRRPFAKANICLSSTWAPWLFGALSSALVAWVWGSLDAAPVVHDEAAYLLQANLFAAGQWAAPAPPHPEFFEQYHLLVTPVFASKYFPGHSLAIAPGAYVGLPGLMPVLMTGITGALVFGLARMAAGPWIALLTTLLWLAAPDNLQWRAGYYSQITSGLLLLAAWGLLARWRAHGAALSLLGVAALLGAAALTRPLTALAFALPVGWIVLADTVRKREWLPLAGAIVVGSLLLLIVPLWSARTTGDWRVTPHKLYTEQYMPWDRMGYSFETTPPARELPDEMQEFARQFEAAYRGHTLTAVPRQLAARAAAILSGGFAGVALLFLPFSLIGIAYLSGPGRFAAASIAVSVAAHLLYPHYPGWTLYYLETLPVLSFIAAIGMTAFVRTLTTLNGYSWRVLQPYVVAVLCAFIMLQIDQIATTKRAVSSIRQNAARVIPTVMADLALDTPAVVFVRLSPDHNPHRNVIVNLDDFRRLDLVIARDRGAENHMLMDAFSDRHAFVLDLTSGDVVQLRSGSSSDTHAGPLLDLPALR